MEAVELGKESDLRSLGPYHQESIGGSFGPNGYNVAGRNAAASQNTDEFNRSVLFIMILWGRLRIQRAFPTMIARKNIPANQGGPFHLGDTAGPTTMTIPTDTKTTAMTNSMIFRLGGMYNL